MHQHQLQTLPFSCHRRRRRAPRLPIQGTTQQHRRRHRDGPGIRHLSNRLATSDGRMAGGEHRYRAAHRRLRRHHQRQHLHLRQPQRSQSPDRRRASPSERSKSLNGNKFREPENALKRTKLPGCSPEQVEYFHHPLRPGKKQRHRQRRPARPPQRPQCRHRHGGSTSAKLRMTRTIHELRTRKRLSSSVTGPTNDQQTGHQTTRELRPRTHQRST